jgi:putative transcriptional regulator
MKMKTKRDWLINIRLQRELTQKEVAEKARIDRSTYAQYESGRRTPTVDNAKGIGNALGFEWTIFFAKDSGIRQQNNISA